MFVGLVMLSIDGQRVRIGKRGTKRLKSDNNVHGTRHVHKV